MNTREKEPDIKKAISIISAANKEMSFTLYLKLVEDTNNTFEGGGTIIRNIYECFRMLGKSLLIAKGKETSKDDYVSSINELLKLKVNTDRPIRVIENLRRMRHNINYGDYIPNRDNVIEAIKIAQTCFKPLREEVQGQISK